MNNPLSFSSVKLDRFSRDGTRLKPATGFVIETGNEYFIIANWHVVTDEEISERKQQEPLIEPYTLKTSIHIYGGEGGNSALLSLGFRKRITIQLYDKNDSPVWIENQAEGQQPTIDIVALPIQLNLTFANLISGKFTESDIKTDYWNKVSAIPIPMIGTNVEYGPPDTVYIVGYPIDWPPEGANKFNAAFWKMSSIASESSASGKTQANAFFIDPPALEGMTGSPVIGMKNDQAKLLGVYSDRSKVDFGINAGLAWRAEAIKELLGVSR